jgi:hypothetical protein
MRREALLFLSLALVACGARTGLLLETEALDGGNDGPSDAPVDVETRPDAPHDAPADAPLRTCPLTAPEAGTACPSSSTQCAYVATLAPEPNGLAAWCCPFGSWMYCATASEMSESCTRIVCFPGIPVECIVGGGKECCTCDAPGGSVSVCGPC